MAENRFKKSVETAASNTNILYNIKDNILENTKDNALDNTSDNTKESILQSVLSKGKKERGGNHTFYLSAEVGEALDSLAKKTKQSKSNLVNDILKAVLME